MFSKVSYETIYRATFNYWEPSLSIDKDGRSFRVYITKYPVRPEPNLVVIDAYDNPDEMYFRTFLGKHGGECETESETQQFLDEIRKTISPEYRMADEKDLEKRILKLLDEVDKGRFSN